VEIYLPIAEVSQNLFLILGLGLGVGLLSGMFGVGGGFLLTPLLIISGIPPGIAVASAANQVVGASVSGCLGHWRRGNVDTKMGMILLAGGFAGSSVGVWLFGWLQSIGQVDLIISLCYVFLLGIIGLLMLLESVRAILRTRTKAFKSGGPVRLNRHRWFHGLPFKMRFRTSKLYISMLLPLGVGAFVGLLSAIMGVGGGFVIVPAMIYLIGMPTSVVIGTSLFQISFVSANVTILQAGFHHTVDVALAVLLMFGGVIGAQFGARLGARIRGEELRFILALMVLGMGLKILYGLATTPKDIYSITYAVL